MLTLQLPPPRQERQGPHRGVAANLVQQDLQPLPPQQQRLPPQQQRLPPRLQRQERQTQQEPQLPASTQRQEKDAATLVRAGVPAATALPVAQAWGRRPGRWTLHQQLKTEDVGAALQTAAAAALSMTPQMLPLRQVMLPLPPGEAWATVCQAVPLPAPQSQPQAG